MMYIIWHDSWPAKTVWYTHADIKWNRTPGNKKKVEGIGHRLFMNTIIFHHLTSFWIYMTN
jgi:hypothetical protein